ncbi:hypothetical protein TWF481_009713 [Arthrobotrys musiformis]|uniref:Uncharacterized protein n=1 Tax=Arthrobotrys musiformis TaxID=47236 RepID=A0AAV9W5Z0_9PEZI
MQARVEEDSETPRYAPRHLKPNLTRYDNNPKNSSCSWNNSSESESDPDSKSDDSKNDSYTNRFCLNIRNLDEWPKYSVKRRIQELEEDLALGQIHPLQEGNIRAHIRDLKNGIAGEHYQMGKRYASVKHLDYSVVAEYPVLDARQFVFSELGGDGLLPMDPDWDWEKKTERRTDGGTDGQMETETEVELSQPN